MSELEYKVSVFTEEQVQNMQQSLKPGQKLQVSYDVGNLRFYYMTFYLSGEKQTPLTIIAESPTELYEKTIATLRGCNG